MRIMIAGTFDNFHIGHQWLLWNANQKNPKALTIIVARDKTVERIKGKAPRNSELDRLKRIEEEVRHHQHIQARLGRTDADFWQTIEEETPQVLYLGYDQQFSDHHHQKALAQGIVVERCSAYAPEFFKSSKF